MKLSIKGITTATLILMLGYLSSNLTPSLATNFQLKPLLSSHSAIPYSNGKVATPTDSYALRAGYANANAQALTSQFALSTSNQDTLIIPGSRVGAVTSKTTRKDLVKLFAQSHLKDGSIYGAEGIGKFSVTRVNLGAEKSFTVVWSNNAKTKPIAVQDLGTAWKTPEGIGVGTSFAQLRQKLGEFKLFGLEWDYGGTVLLEKTKLSRYYGKMMIQVEAAQNAADKFPNDYRVVSGDQELSSTNPHWKPLGMRVGEISVVLNSSK